ncbi:MAG: hypothetical protein ACE5J2_03600 [Nitrososphaerales archaeon]
MGEDTKQVVAPVMMIGLAIVIAAPLAGLVANPLGPSSTVAIANVVDGTESLFWQIYFKFSNFLPYLGVAAVIEIIALLSWKHLLFPKWKKMNPTKQRIRARVKLLANVMTQKVVPILRLLAVFAAIGGMMIYDSTILPYIGMGAGIVLSAFGAKKLSLQLFSKDKLKSGIAMQKIGTPREQIQ